MNSQIGGSKTFNNLHFASHTNSAVKLQIGRILRRRRRRRRRESESPNLFCLPLPAEPAPTHPNILFAADLLNQLKHTWYNESILVSMMKMLFVVQFL